MINNPIAAGKQAPALARMIGLSWHNSGLLSLGFCRRMAKPNKPNWNFSKTFFQNIEPPTINDGLRGSGKLPAPSRQKWSTIWQVAWRLILFGLKN
jgi:hypothetical protein